MNYTKNYHLPQWVKEDRIMMDDFNRMCADMEAGLTKNAQDLKTGLNKTAQDAAAATASAAATAAAASSAAMTAAQEAQTTADKAVADAAQAQATADAAYCPSQKPYAVGTYTGTMREQTFTLGFSPQFLIITCPSESSWDVYSTIACSTYHVGELELTATGFIIKPTAVDGCNQSIPPLLNISKRTYVYIAFR